ncbi:Trp family transcriptional regulator [Marinomonas sp. 15G1-11]|uniref:Trp family transcriptional regulator n=1 Tax=Marinomonas phaeophyticola TaxID=3004091 RepID=A0ABT4K0V9_9GAMM|nr:Trp family transcriptional regulator [Marinomonas sp. 15G1-11]MCZ2723648.1 Trp family transcriptional regulator [Marinomonas sp. 15G1-11]
MQELAKYFLAAKDEQAMQKLLRGLLTPNEVNEMGKRLQIFALLKEGVSQREIAKQLGVGIATVTRGSRALKELEEK